MSNKGEVVNQQGEWLLDIGNNMMAAGDARASGIAAQGNALSGAISGLSNLYGYTRGAGGSGPTMANNYRGPMYGSYG